MKQCTKCKEEKPLSEFHRRSDDKTKTRGMCKVCTNLDTRKWSERNVDQVKAARKVKHIQYYYGITKDQYDKAMSSSNCCEICGHIGNTSADRQLNYDHDHSTGLFRGVLCRTCNQAIGQLGDTKESVKKAYDYLVKSDSQPIRIQGTKGKRYQDI